MGAPFLGVELPDNFDDSKEGQATETEPTSTEADKGTDSGFEVGNGQKDSKEAASPETINQALKDLVDLDKHERFRWQGREWTRQELTDGTLMRADYSRKTQELQEARKYADNFDADLSKVVENPALFDEFRKIYPKRYIQAAQRIIDRLEPQNKPAPTPTNSTTSLKDNPTIRELLEWKSEVEQSVKEARTQANLQWLDSQHEKMSPKFPLANAELVDKRLGDMLSQDKNLKVTEALMETLYKKASEDADSLYKSHYKKQVDEQKKASAKAKDVGRGSGVTSKEKSLTMKEARQALFNHVDTQ